MRSCPDRKLPVPVLMFKVMDKVTLVAKDHEFFRAGIQIFLFHEIKFCSSPERAVCRKILFLLKYRYCTITICIVYNQCFESGSAMI
jgi:hypothetical protein